MVDNEDDVIQYMIQANSEKKSMVTNFHDTSTTSLRQLSGKASEVLIGGSLVR